MFRIPYLKFNVPKAMYLFALAFGIFSFANSVAGSIFPLYLKQFSDSIFFLGVIASASSVLALFLSVYIGEAVDKYGTKMFLLLGLLVTSILYVGYYFAPWVSLVIILQILVGLSRELVYTPFFSLVRDATSRNKLAESFSLVQAVSTAGLIIGPLIGGYLALNNLRIPFLVSALLVLVSYFVLMKSKEPKFAQRKVDLSFNCFRSAWNDFMKLGREAKHLAFTTLTLHSWYSAKWFMGPLLLVYLGYNSSEIGIWLSISLIPFLLLAMPFGSFADHGNNKTRIILWGLMFSLIPLMMLGFSNGIWLYFFIVAIAIGNVLSDTVLEARITELTPKNEYGEVTGIIEAIKNLGWMTGPLITTLFAQIWGYQYAFVPLVAMSATSIILLAMDAKGR